MRTEHALERPLSTDHVAELRPFSLSSPDETVCHLVVTC